MTNKYPSTIVLVKTVIYEKEIVISGPEIDVQDIFEDACNEENGWELMDIEITDHLKK